MRLNLGTLAVAALLLIYLGWLTRDLPWTPLRIAGAAIAVPAVVLLIMARLQLGRSFSVQAKATHLVATGLYSRIRNPIYVFSSLVIVGIILWLAKPIFLLLLAVIIPVQIYRARKEEQILTEKFGDAYREYKQKTWF